MKSRDRGEKMVKKPKKDAKSKTMKEEAPPMVVEVVRKKRKERESADAS